MGVPLVPVPQKHDDSRDLEAHYDEATQRGADRNLRQRTEAQEEDEDPLRPPRVAPVG